jgi:hypothetical protein
MPSSLRCQSSLRGSYNGPFQTLPHLLNARIFTDYSGFDGFPLTFRLFNAQIDVSMGSLGGAQAALTMSGGPADPSKGSLTTNLTVKSIVVAPSHFPASPPTRKICLEGHILPHLYSPPLISLLRYCIRVHDNRHPFLLIIPTLPQPPPPLLDWQGTHLKERAASMNSRPPPRLTMTTTGS